MLSIMTDNIIKNKNTFDGFELPITYLDTTAVHPLSPVVAADLELDAVSSTESVPMYEVLLKPKSAVSKSMIQQWCRLYTSDVGFLKETQHVIANIPKDPTNDLDKMSAVWKDLYDSSEFYDRYGYIDFKPVHSLNHMSGFLGCWTIVNLLSPLLSLFLPLIFLVAPFVLLKIQGVPIDFGAYITVLKSVAKNHAVGKLLTSFDDFSINNLIYVVFTLALYGLQMYQNTKACMRFYKNIFAVNTNLLLLQEFVCGSIKNMELYLNIFTSKMPTKSADLNGKCDGFHALETREGLNKNGGLSKYAVFNAELETQLETLRGLRDELADVRPFTFGVSKCFEVGYLLKCYYSMHVIPEYKAAFQYAMGFEAYREGLASICEAVGSAVNYGGFSTKTRFTQQIYPTHVDGGVPNDVCLEKNLVITGPNGSGKTSQLKATAINVIFTQQFGVGFYESCELAPYTHIHSYLNIPDTSGRDSLFQAEARRCKEILDIIETPESDDTRHFAVFDELFSGTNAEEATSASYAFLKFLQKKSNVDFILTTHFEKLCKRIHKAKHMRIVNKKMEAFVDGNNIKFTYEMKDGYSKIKGAKLILIQMDFPEEIVGAM